MPRITVRLTDAELESLKRAAGDASISDAIRQAINTNAHVTVGELAATSRHLERDAALSPEGRKRVESIAERIAQ